MKRSTVRLAILGVAAAFAIAGLRMTPSWAYFTASSEAEGSMEIRVRPTTSIDELMEDGSKMVRIVNDESSSSSVFVRARIFANEKYLADGTPAGDGWTQGSDGYWYYTAGPVAPGDATNDLQVKIEWPVYDDEGDVIDHAGENFNIIVVYEATPVQYKDGELVDPMSSDCDWDLAATE